MGDSDGQGRFGGLKTCQVIPLVAACARKTGDAGAIHS
jgi:hypothetical protein